MSPNPLVVLPLLTCDATPQDSPGCSRLCSERHNWHLRTIVSPRSFLILSSGISQWAHGWLHWPVYEAPALQIAHATGYLRRDVHEHHRVDLILVAVPQVVQQVAFAHKLCDDIERWLSCAHTCKRSSTVITHSVSMEIISSLFSVHYWFTTFHQHHCYILS